MREFPVEPERWRKDASLRPAAADVLLRGARRPQPAGSDELARLGMAIDDIPRRSALSARRWTRITSAAAGIATLIALGTGVWAWRGRHLAPSAPAVASVEEIDAPARAPHARRTHVLPGVAPARPAARRSIQAPHAKRPMVAAPPAPAVTQPADDHLTREIALVDDARAQVTSAPARALVAIEAHRREFPSGQLAAEREFLAVEALRRLNRLDEARRRAAALAARYPSSSYAARATRALSGGR